MNSSNDKPSNAKNRSKKRLLVVDGQNRRADDLKPSWESANQEVIESDDKQEIANPQSRSRLNARAIVWTAVGIVVPLLAWAFATQMELTIERVISATGQLSTRSTIQTMQAPEKKVVKTVFVKEGDRVKKGQSLVAFDSVNAYEKLKTLETQRQSLVQKNEFYRLALESNVSMTQVEGEILRLKLPREAAFLVRNRTALVAANQQYQEQEQEQANAANNATPPSSSSQSSPAVSQANEQRTAASITVNEIREEIERNQSQQEETQDRLTQAQEKLAQMRSLVAEGAIARVQYIEQQQLVRSIEEELDELRSQQQTLQTRLLRATEQLTNTPVVIRTEIVKPRINYQKQIADNKKQIVEIDSQLAKIVTENQRQIAELDRQIDRVKPSSNAYILKAPEDGTVVEVLATPGFNAQDDRKSTLLKLKSDDRYLVAQVLIPKGDIEFIQEGMTAEVSIDVSPLNQLGTIRGQVMTVGSDALPPDTIHHFYGIPAKIAIDRQALSVATDKIPSRSGMPATVSIKVQNKQTLAAILWQKFFADAADR